MLFMTWKAVVTLGQKSHKSNSDQVFIHIYIHTQYPPPPTSIMHCARIKQKPLRLFTYSLSKVQDMFKVAYFTVWILNWRSMLGC